MIESAVRLLGLDPGFASLGWAVVEFGAGERLVALGVLRTEKADRKQLAERMPFASHTGLATQAMRIGLAHIATDPSVLMKPLDEMTSRRKT